MHLSELQQMCHDISKDKGFWEANEQGIVRPLPETLMLCTSELAEALEENRSNHAEGEVYFNEAGKPEGVPVEMADCVIRILDWAGHAGVNLEEIIITKLNFNKNRPHKHGRNY